MTAKDAVFDLLKREKERADSAVIGVEAARHEWLQALAELISQLQKWLSVAEQELLVSVKEHSVSIHEERLGTYDAPALELRTPGGLAIDIRPRARFVVGGMGRVDFSASPKSAILVRKDRTTWQFARLAADKGRWSFVALDEDSFWQTLNELMM